MDHLNILIAEDEVVSRLVLKRAIDGFGHECRVANDGDAAWEMFQSDVPDVVISDWVMPKMDGLELCRLVRQAETNKYVYFILLTALGDKAHFREGMRAGADDYIAKPFDSDELEARLLAAGRVMDLHRRLALQ